MGESILASDGKVAKLLWVNDGHGTMGETAAAAVSEFLVAQYSMPGQLAEIQCAIKTKDSMQVQRIIEGMYGRTALHLEKTLGFSHEGGTTCSHVLLVEVQGANYVITSNMGDSPVIIVDPTTGKVLQTHGNHNWDNIEEYRLYDKQCREKGAKPSDAVYNRFNCGNGQLPGPNGDCKPIPIFKRDDQTSEITVDSANLEYITKVMAGWGVIGGLQSEGKMVMADASGKAKAPAPGFGHQNWGSVVLLEDTNNWGGTTLEGGTQCTRSFADFTDQRLAHTVGHTPTVNITAVGANAVVLVMSDGAADVIGYMHQFGKKVRDLWHSNQIRRGGYGGVEAGMVVQGIGQWIMCRGASTTNYGLRNGSPCWDDVTIAGATFLTRTVPKAQPKTQQLKRLGSLPSSRDLDWARFAQVEFKKDAQRRDTLLHTKCRFQHSSSSSPSYLSATGSDLRVSF